MEYYISRNDNELVGRWLKLYKVNRDNGRVLTVNVLKKRISTIKVESFNQNINTPQAQIFIKTIFSDRFRYLYPTTEKLFNFYLDKVLHEVDILGNTPRDLYMLRMDILEFLHYKIAPTKGYLVRDGIVKLFIKYKVW